MFGPGYESWEYDRVIEVAGRGLLIERVERLLQVESEYLLLKSQLAEAESAYQSTPAGEPSARLTAAEKLRDTCKSLAENRFRLTTLGRPENESATFKARASAVEEEIPRLRQEAEKQRVAELHAKANATSTAAAKLKAEIQRRKPGTRSEWEEKKSLVSQYANTLANLQETHGLLNSAGSPVSNDVIVALRRDQGAFKDMLTALEIERGRIQVRELDSKFQAMQSQRMKLEAAYMKSFRSPQESSAMNALTAHLREMYDNRVAAERAGSKQAAGQAAALLKDLQKFK
jgi:hypothetical protein